MAGTIRLMISNKPLAVRVLFWLFIIVIALLPFHAFISTWLISNFGLEPLFKAWKELLLFVVMVPLAVWIALKNIKIRDVLIKDRTNQLIVLFAVFNILLAVPAANGQQAAVAGLLFNLRFLALFIVAEVLALSVTTQKFRQLVLKIILWGGVIVVLFGALQVLLLPHDFLRHFGYTKDLIPPYFTIDNNENIVRILSTLRGPNALGAYLVFWLPLLAVATKKLWSQKTVIKVGLIVVWLASLLTLYGSRSRSAWIGVLVAGATLTLLQVNNLWRKRLLIAGSAVAVILGLCISLNFNSHLVQTTLLHRDPNEINTIDSDNQHADSLNSALRHVISRPLGTGVGTANLASTYGNQPNIVENYYLQIAVELGIVGCLLFIALLVLVAVRLWRLRSDTIAAALFAGFIGIFVINLLLPAWGDETLSMLWWGLAGIVFVAKPKKVVHSK